MSEGPRILVINSLAARHREAINAAAPNATILTKEITDAADAIRDAEILVAWGFNNIQPFYANATKLRWIHALTAGVESLVFPETQKDPVFITNSKGIHGIPMAEHVLGMILAFTRQLPLLLKQQSGHIWNRPHIDTLQEINGKTMAIVGLGAIGQEIARKAKAMDMKVIAARREMKQEPHVDRLYRPEQLLDMLSEADFVVVTLPITEQTKDLIGRDHFAAMKPTAYFLNVSRGGVVQESELIRALQEQRIAGAGLDVVAEEPLPAESPLWDMPNVIITPHLSAISPVYLDRAIQLFAKNLELYVQNKPLFNLIDKARGY